MSSYSIAHDELLAPMEDLRQREEAPGQWGLGGTRMPFGDDLQKLFPVVGRFLGQQGRPAVSRLSPDEVVSTFKGIFV